MRVSMIKGDPDETIAGIQLHILFNGKRPDEEGHCVWVADTAGYIEVVQFNEDDTVMLDDENKPLLKRLEGKVEITSRDPRYTVEYWKQFK